MDASDPERPSPPPAAADPASASASTPRPPPARPGPARPVPVRQSLDGGGGDLQDSETLTREIEVDGITWTASLVGSGLAARRSGSLPLIEIRFTAEEASSRRVLLAAAGLGTLDEGVLIRALAKATPDEGSG